MFWKKYLTKHDFIQDQIKRFAYGWQLTTRVYSYMDAWIQNSIKILTRLMDRLFFRNHLLAFNKMFQMLDSTRLHHQICTDNDKHWIYEAGQDIITLPSSVYTDMMIRVSETVGYTKTRVRIFALSQQSKFLRILRSFSLNKHHF